MARLLLAGSPNLEIGGHVMGDGKRFGVYAFGFVVVALLACFVIGFLIIPTFMENQPDSGPTGAVPALPTHYTGLWV